MSIMSNSIRSSGSYRQNSLHEKLHSTPSVEEKVKFAGDDSKDRLYEPKQNKKMVRVLTVVIYIFSVSLAAIMLSLYYVFFWNPKGPHYLAHKIDMAQESVGLRDDDNVTNRNTTAPHRCLENLARHGLGVEETTTALPFQLDNALSDNNATGEDTDTTLIMNETEHSTVSAKSTKMIQVLLNKISNDTKHDKSDIR